MRAPLAILGFLLGLTAWWGVRTMALGCSPNDRELALHPALDQAEK